MVIGVGVGLFKRMLESAKSYVRDGYPDKSMALIQCKIKSVDPVLIRKNGYSYRYSWCLQDFTTSDIKNLCKMILSHRRRERERAERRIS